MAKSTKKVSEKVIGSDLKNSKVSNTSSNTNKKIKVETVKKETTKTSKVQNVSEPKSPKMTVRKTTTSKTTVKPKVENKISEIKKTVSKPAVKKSKTTVESEKLLMPKHVKHVMITQPEPVGEKSPYSEISKKYNFKVDFKPLLMVESISLREFRKQKINVPEFTAVIFNSKNAIDYFFKICEELRHKMPQDAKYFCASETIALYLQKYIKYRKRKVIYSNGTLEDFQSILIKHQSAESFILPCSSVGIGLLPKFLKDKKFKFVEAIMYQMVPNMELKDKPLHHEIVTFFNPEGVRAFKNIFPNFVQNEIIIGAFGEATIKSLESLGLRVLVQAPKGEIKSMVMGIDKLFKDYPKLQKN
jgi:uroporphyrinogen-III synthase